MLYRCTNCDFLGENVSENEDYETICPECNDICFEFEEMSDEDIKKLQGFFENNLLIPPDRKDIKDDSRFLWDDWDILKSFLAENKNVYLYTLISCEEDTMYISKGNHYINRVGYYLSFDDIPFENDIRYW